MEYVLGFAFIDRALVLIEKKKPEWQAGFMNGVGGKVEKGERIDIAMTREFLEEAGILVIPSDWTKFTRMTFITGAVVHCFATRLRMWDNPRTMTDEPIRIVEVTKVFDNYHKTLGNLRWLIPMAEYALANPLTNDIPEVLDH